MATLVDRIIERVGGGVIERALAEQARTFEASAQAREASLEARLSAMAAQAEQAARRASEAYAQGYGDGHGDDEPAQGTTARLGYRQASGANERTLAVDYRKLLAVAWNLYQSNPVAARVLKIKVAYILGINLTPQYGSDALKLVGETFWRKNDLDDRLAGFVLQWRLWGEQVYPAFVRQADGLVRLGYIEPETVERVVCHPGNAMEPWAVVVAPRTFDAEQPWVGARDKRVYRVIREDEGAVIAARCAYCGESRPGTAADGKCLACAAPRDDLAIPPRYPGKLITAEQATLEDWEHRLLETHGLTEYSGSCFLWRANNVSNQPRGMSDLLQVVDWLDQLDEVLFALADREQLANLIGWDVTVKNADEGVVNKRAAQIRLNPPRKGSANVHNDAEEWKLEHPDVKQTGSIETVRELIIQILGGLGIPMHWYGRGDETNRATAQAQGDPTWRTLELEQGAAKARILKLLYFARDQAEIAGALQYVDPVTGQPLTGAALELARAITLVMPQMTAKDTAAAAQAFATLAAAVATVVAEGYLTRAKGLEILAKAAAELGVEVDPAQELDAVDKERQAQAEQGQAERNGALQSALGRHGEFTANAGASVDAAQIVGARGG